MIWDLLQDSSFNTHFTNLSLTITTLLLDQNIITQLKNQNPQLLQYLSQNKHNFIQQMLIYITTMPTIQDTYDRAYKLPYISSQLLALNSQLIYQQFFKKQIKQEDNSYWSRLLGFLDDDKVHNQILIGYFQKVINNLYNGNKIKTCRIISLNLNKFLKLLNNQSIGTILKNCIILLIIPDGQVLPQRLHILSTILTQLIQNVQQIKKVCVNMLIDIINKFQTYSSGDIIISNLINHQSFLKIYKQQNSIAINQLIITLIIKSQQITVNQYDQPIKILTLPPIHHTSIGSYLKKQLLNLDQYIKSQTYIKNQSGNIVRKSNKYIYSILNLLNLTIEYINIDFISYQLIKQLWILVGLYPFNNILQVTIIKIFTNILKKQKIQHLILNHYESYLLELADINLEMFRPFIFKLWSQCKKYKVYTTDLDVLRQFGQFVQKYLEPLVKYQVNKDKIRQSQRKNNKLIVDQEDKTQKDEKQVVVIERQEVIEIVPYKFKDQKFNQLLNPRPIQQNFFNNNNDDSNNNNNNSNNNNGNASDDMFNFDQFKKITQQSTTKVNDNPFGNFDSFF